MKKSFLMDVFKHKSLGDFLEKGLQLPFDPAYIRATFGVVERSLSTPEILSSVGKEFHHSLNGARTDSAFSRRQTLIGLLSLAALAATPKRLISLPARRTAAMFTGPVTFAAPATDWGEITSIVTFERHGFWLIEVGGESGLRRLDAPRAVPDL